MKKQIKKADKSGAEVALILGENELENNQLMSNPCGRLMTNKHSVGASCDALKPLTQE